LLYFILLTSLLSFAHDYSLYVNEKGQFDLEASFEISPLNIAMPIQEFIQTSFHDESLIQRLNKTADFEIREQKYQRDGAGLKLTTKSCKKKFLWFCKELEFNCEVSLSDSSFNQACRLDFNARDAKTVFDKSMEVLNTLHCQKQGGKILCSLTAKGWPRETLLTDSKRLAIAGSTETLRGFFQMQEFLEAKSSSYPDPIKGAELWQAHYDLGMSCSKKHQVFKILGKSNPLKRTCLEVPMK
jgi:hypothetical protein